MKRDSVIFDVDGTLWNTTEVVAEAWNTAVEEAGVEAETITAGILKREFGKPMNVIANHLFPKADAAEKEKIMDLCCKYEHEFVGKYEKNLLYPNVCETIIELSKTHKVCIVSNCQKGYIELFLKKNNLEEYVTDIECYGNTLKSKGENIKAVVERNHFQDSVYVGDTQGDYDAAMFAGIPFIFAKYGFGNVNGEYEEINEMSELFNFV